MCRAWRATGAGLPELWESVEAGPWFEPRCTQTLLRWLDAWCATRQRPLRRLELNLYEVDTMPGLEAGVVAVLRRSSASLQHLSHGPSYWDQSVRSTRAQASFLAAIAALQQLTSLEIWGKGADLPASKVLPTSLQWLIYHCGVLPRQISQLTRLERLSLGRRTPLPASLALLPSLRALDLNYTGVHTQLTCLTRLEALTIYGSNGGVDEANKHITALARLTKVRDLWQLALAVAAHSADRFVTLCPCSSRR